MRRRFGQDWPQSFKSCPREGASTPTSGGRCNAGVSSHAPVRGHQRRRAWQHQEPGCFKSCPREGASIRGCEGDVIDYEVSSHAPVRGHPRIAPQARKSQCVSSHAPVRGHRADGDAGTVGTICFKSCPREGASPRPGSNPSRHPAFQVMPP